MTTLKFTYNVEDDLAIKIIDTIAIAENYQDTIEQPVMDISGNTQFDTSGNTITEIVPNVAKKQFAQDIIDKRNQAYVYNCFDKVEK